MNQHAAKSRALSVAQWRELTKEGLFIPVRFHLSGNSMWPLIRIHRDQVTVHPIHRPLKRGDIVLFADDLGRYVVHRVWKLEEDHVVTLGDHCHWPDAPLRYDQIWGLVTEMERSGRRVSLDCRASRAWGLVWMGLFPVRKAYYTTRAFAGCIYRKLKGR